MIARRAWAPALPPGALAPSLAWTALLLALGVAIAALEPLWLALGVAGTSAALLLLARPLLALPALLFAVPFGGLAAISLGDFGVTATEPLVALLALGWLAQGVVAKRVVLGGATYLAALGPLLALLLLSITYAGSPSLALKETLKWLELALVLVITADLARDRPTVGMVLGALFLAGGLEALWGVAQVATGQGPDVFAVGGALRAFGHFEQPNPFAGYLATILPLAVALSVPGLGGRLPWLARGAALATGGAILLSQSRGAWLGVATAATVVALLWGPATRRLLLPAVATLAGVALASLAGLLPASLFDRLSQTLSYFGVFDVRTVELTSENWAVVERMAHWQAGWDMFLDAPWLGVGAGNYPHVYPRYYLADWLDPLGHAHNYYLNTLAELGVVGLALFATFLVVALRQVLSALRASRAASSDALFWRLLLVGTLGALVVFCTHNLFDNLLVHSINVQIGILLGLAVTAADRLRGASATVRHAG